MSETREAFRRNLATIHDETFEASMQRIRPEATTNEDLWRGQEEALQDAAEAVYAQALRDVQAYATEAEYDPNPGMTASGVVDDFAAERGIDLSEAQP